MKDDLFTKVKKSVDYIAIIGVIYILAYQIKAIRKIGIAICQYFIKWFLNTDMDTLKGLYVLGERVFRIFILIAVAIIVILKIIQGLNERKMKSAKGESRFEKSLLKYLQDKSTPRAFLITGKWGSGKTYEINHFLEKYYKNTKTKVYRVSCFGLSTRKELIKELNTVIEQGDNSIYTMIIRVLGYLPVIGEAINKFLKKSYEYNSLNKEAIFIFDDFERITSRSIVGEASKRLYRQSPFMLSNVHGGRDSIQELRDIKEELEAIDKAFSQVESFITQHSMREDYDKYIAVIGLINELIEIYGVKVIIICNSDILGEKFIHEVLRSKLNCIEYKKVITAEVKTAVIDNIVKNKLCDDEQKQECIISYINSVKNNIEAMMLDSKFNDLRLFGGLLEAFIDTALLFEKNVLSKNFLNSLLNSILIMHMAYYKNSIHEVASYVNGANIKFLVNLFGGPIDTTNLIEISHSSEEIKWIDIRVSGYWIFNLSKPENLTEIYEPWKNYKYSSLENNIINNHRLLDTETDYNYMHILLYQKRQDRNDSSNVDYSTHLKIALQEYDLKDKVQVEYILNITYQVYRGWSRNRFCEALFEVLAKEYGNGPLSIDTYFRDEYIKYVENRIN